MTSVLHAERESRLVCMQLARYFFLQIKRGMPLKEKGGEEGVKSFFIARSLSASRI